MNRRAVLIGLGLGAAGGVVGAYGQDGPIAEPYREATRGLPPLKITNVVCIRVLNLNVVKVETSEPGLYGLGCATFQQRPMAVETAVKDYLAPFAVGTQCGQCRGPLADRLHFVLLAKRARVEQCPERSGPGAVGYQRKTGQHARLPTVGRQMPLRRRYLQALSQDAMYLSWRKASSERSNRDFATCESKSAATARRISRRTPIFRTLNLACRSDEFMEPGPYLRSVPKMFEHIRTTCGEQVELLHDIHERVPPIDAINLVKQLEPYRPFFIEDPFPPEANGYFRMLRQQTSTPIAMGELFNSPHEWVNLITERLIDFIRVHISQTGGLSVARKIAALAEWFGVRTAWHGPSDVSPAGHAANAHLDLAIHNFGIQEMVQFSDEMRAIFPGCPTVKNGYMYVNESPGLGVDIDEQLAAKAGAWDSGRGNWQPLRRRDGTSVRQ